MGKILQSPSNPIGCQLSESLCFVGGDEAAALGVIKLDPKPVEPLTMRSARRRNRVNPELAQVPSRLDSLSRSALRSRYPVP
jgi:hypothetical protein